MNYEPKAINEAIKNFLVDENLLKAINWQKEINIFSIVDFSEPRHSVFLSWLLNPNQAHGLGDLVMKELLKNCTYMYEKIQGKEDKLSKTWFNSLQENEFFKGFPLDVIDSTSFTNTIVHTEFKAGKGKERVDICLVDENNELIVFIENKYGAKESNGQMEKYYKYLVKKYPFEKFYTLFVFLDVNYDEENNSNISPNWIAINYEWLSQLLKSVLGRHVLTKQVRRIIRDYYVYISEDYKVEPYYADCLSAIKQLAHKNRELVDIFKNYRPKQQINRPVTDLSFEETKGLDKTSKKLYDLFQKYMGVIIGMMEYSTFDLIKDLIEKEIGTNDDRFDIKNSYFFFTSLELAGFSKDGIWPAYIGFHKSNRASNNVTKSNQIYIEINFAQLSEENTNKIKKIVEELSKEKLKYISNYKRVLIENISTDYSPQQIANKLLKLYNKLERINSCLVKQ